MTYYKLTVKLADVEPFYIYNVTLEQMRAISKYFGGYITLATTLAGQEVCIETGEPCPAQEVDIFKLGWVSDRKAWYLSVSYVSNHQSAYYIGKKSWARNCINAYHEDFASLIQEFKSYYPKAKIELGNCHF